MKRRTLLFSLFFACQAIAQDLKIQSKSRVVTFDMTIAQDNTARAKGFMFRKSLNPREAILFVYEHPQRVRMWMKNTYVSLDMLFIDENGKIVHIHENAEPHSLKRITYDYPVKAVLEIAGGQAKKLGLSKGDTLQDPIFATQ